MPRSRRTRALKHLERVPCCSLAPTIHGGYSGQICTWPSDLGYEAVIVIIIFQEHFICTTTYSGIRLDWPSPDSS
ncbi:hypothetical protein RSAG8_07955, partial [Rhizoctonia solani AG-8 WAC10335]